MATRDELLNHLWKTAIDSNLNTASLAKFAASASSNPDDFFSDSGQAIQRMLDAGISAHDIGLANRYAAFVAVFQTLYSIGDPGVENDDVFMLHESLLSADPTGREGKPG